jgi:hypothetical protein
MCLHFLFMQSSDTQLLAQGHVLFQIGGISRIFQKYFKHQKSKFKFVVYGTSLYNRYWLWTRWLGMIPDRDFSLYHYIQIVAGPLPPLSSGYSHHLKLRLEMLGDTCHQCFHGMVLN